MGVWDYICYIEGSNIFKNMDYEKAIFELSMVIKKYDLKHIKFLKKRTVGSNTLLPLRFEYYDEENLIEIGCLFNKEMIADSNIELSVRFALCNSRMVYQKYIDIVEYLAIKFNGSIVLNGWVFEKENIQNKNFLFSDHEWRDYVKRDIKYYYESVKDDFKNNIVPLKVDDIYKYVKKWRLSDK
jgi:hypothetical protein